MKKIILLAILINTISLSGQKLSNSYSITSLKEFAKKGKDIYWTTSMRSRDIDQYLETDTLETYIETFHKYYSINGKYEDFKYKVIPILQGGYGYHLREVNREAGIFASLDYKTHWKTYLRFKEGYASKLIIDKQFINREDRQTWRGTGKNIEYSEMIGAISYHWNWGYFGLKYDRPEMSNSIFQSSIISGLAPTMGMLELHAQPLPWFSLDYFHGKLNSNVVDSTSSFGYAGGQRTVYRSKYIACNMLNLYPFKKLKISMGNSVIYADQSIDIGYLLPFFLYRTVDHNNGGFNNNAGQNGQMFASTIFNNHKNIEIQGTFFVDEFNFKTLLDGKKGDGRNQFSYQVGTRIRVIKNLVLSSEYTAVFPYVYRHHIPTTTFEHSDYNLGFFTKDNATNIDIAMDYFFDRFHFQVFYNKLIKGKYVPFNASGSGTSSGVKLLEEIEYTKKTFGLSISYRPFQYFSVHLEYNYHQLDGDFSSFYPKSWENKTHTYQIQTGLYF